MRSLQARMFLVFALIATLPLIALSYLALESTRSALADEVGKAHQDAATAAAGFVDVYVDDARVLMEAEARATQLQLAANASDAGALEARLSGLVDSSLYQSSAIYASAIYLNETGRVVASWPAAAAARGDDWSGRAEFVTPLARNQSATLEVSDAGAAIMPVATPVLLPGAHRGVLVANLNVATLGRALQAFAPGRSQGFYLTDVHGHLIYPGDATAPRLDLSATAPVQQATRARSGYVEFDDPVARQAALAAYAPTRLGWNVIDSVPTVTAFQALSRLSGVLIVLSGILAGGILLAGVVLARRIVRPVIDLTDAAQALSAGRLSTRIKPRGDDELARLGLAFNEMAERISESLEGLRRSEARYRGLVESANDLILTIQLDGQLGFVGPLAKPIFGREPHELVGASWETLVATRDRAAFGAALARVLEGEPVVHVAHGALRADGATVDMVTTLSPVFDGDDAPARVLAVARDVTQERQEERVRSKSFEMARLVSGEADLGVLATRGLALLLDVAQMRDGAAFIGSGDALREVGTTGLDMLSRQSVQGLRVLASLGALSREPRTESLDGGRAAIAIPLVERGESLGAVVLVGAEREVRAQNPEVLVALAQQLALGIRRSLFEARLKDYASTLERRVEERTQELTAKNQEMESFLYSVSHDLKAPLISIQGYAQGLEEDFAAVLDAEGQQYLERIRRNASLMESLILDILELSRIGRVREDVGAVDMNAVMSQIAERLGDRFTSAGGALIVEPHLPPVRGEEKRLGQLLTNLVDNAVKYRHPNRAPRVTVSARTEGAEVILQVRDNGRGVPARYQDRLFNIFQRVTTPGMDDPGGTGMGLAIAKRIVETHGGRIWVESVEGQGTTFFVALPAADEA